MLNKANDDPPEIINDSTKTKNKVKNAVKGGDEEEIDNEMAKEKRWGKHRIKTVNCRENLRKVSMMARMVFMMIKNRAQTASSLDGV